VMSSGLGSRLNGDTDDTPPTPSESHLMLRGRTVPILAVALVMVFQLQVLWGGDPTWNAVDARAGSLLVEAPWEIWGDNANE